MPTHRKVLIVDDERDLVGPLALRLAASGRYEVAVAFDGVEGLAKAVEFHPDAALIDLAMPGLDGWQLCRLLHADPRTRGARIIIMTAWLSPDLGRRAHAEGVSEVLLKPFEEDDLLRALERESAGVTAGGPP